MRLIKKIIALTVLYVPALIKVAGDILKRFFLKIYKPLFLDYLLLLFCHRYLPRSFNPFQYKANVKQLWRMKKNDWIYANRSGRLYLVSSTWLKGLVWLQNILSLGAFRKRLERSIYFTFLSMEIEFLNPYDERAYKLYIERKLAYLNRLLVQVEQLNRSAFDVKPILHSIRSYQMGSIKQAQVIKQMKAAYRRQGVPQIVKIAQEGLDSGLFPVLITHGRSGSYWMRSRQKEVLGIFKPFDEEPFAINNPARTGEYAALGKRMIRPGVGVGEAAHNEVAAYLLDSFFGFGIVPRTCYACFTHQAFFVLNEKGHAKKKKKYGSFQEYIEGFVPIPKLPRDYLAHIPLDEYQTMLFFDLLTGNSDRHLNNLLIGEDKLAAIDHGLCFTDSAPDMPMIVWTAFPQSNEPFHPEISKLAHQFPFERVSWKLRKNCFRSLQSMERMRERLALFSAALDADLLPSQMTRLLTWENFAKLMHKGSYVDEIAKKMVENYNPEPPALQRWLYL